MKEYPQNVKLLITREFPHSEQIAQWVTNPLPAPTTCRYCGDEVWLEENKEVYGRNYGEWPLVYLCRGCKARVGVHPGTHIPLGTLANDALGKARRDAKRLFYAWQKRACISRNQAYKQLAHALGIEEHVCHFGWFEPGRCRQVIEMFDNDYDGDLW